MRDYEQLGRLAFTAYVAVVGGQTHDGKLIPGWFGLTDQVRSAWCAAAEAVDSRRLPIPSEGSNDGASGENT